MTDVKPRLPLWPFLIVDLAFVGVAVFLFSQGHRPLLWWEAGLLIACTACGAWSFLTPHLRRSADEQAFSQAKLLADATSQIQKLDQLASHIGGATQHWREFQGSAAQTVEVARGVSERMSTEAKAFTEFLQKTSETEKAHLRVEVEKLRRAEGERLQLIIHLLDHVFALFQAARRSEQPGVLEQITQFQNACRDAARRIGLMPVMSEPGEVFDAAVHQLPDSLTPAENAVIADTLATGYTYQGKILRRPLVALRDNTGAV